MSPELIRLNYERGLWSVGMVAVAVQKGVITPEIFEDITGVQYQSVVMQDEPEVSVGEV